MESVTQHAACRMQQRGIKQETLGILLLSGAREYDHCGGTILYFDKPTRRRLRQQFCSDRYRKFERQLDAYAVVAQNGTIVTVGHRTKRINRH